MIAAAALGGVQRRVRARNQFDEIVGGGRPGNDAETHSNDAKLPDTLMRNCQFFNLAANTLGESKCGKQSQSIEPFMPTKATVRMLPMIP